MDKAVTPLKNLAVLDASVCNDSKTDVVKRSNEEGNWNNMSEDSSQEEKVQFFVMFLGQRQKHNVHLRSSAPHERTPMRSGSWLPSGKRARAAQDIEADEENTTVSGAHGSAHARRQALVEGRWRPAGPIITRDCDSKSVP